MHLRPIAESDLEIARQLRNANRHWFFYEHEISPEQQSAWFRALESGPVDFYVIEDAGVVVGTISATRHPDRTEIGNLVLLPAARGRGLMRRAVEELTAASGRYVASIKTDNAPSIAVFKATGFAIVSSEPIVRMVKDV